MPDRNTPIFNRLKAERGYEPRFPGHLVRPAFQFRSAGISPLKQTTPEPVIPLRIRTPYTAPEAWIAKPVPRMTSPKEKNARLKVNIHPEEAEHVNTYGMEGFIRARLNEFSEKHPNAVDVTISTKDEIDGTVTILIEGYENTGVVITKKPVWPVAEEAKGESFVVRGLSETMPPVFRTEPKTEEIPPRIVERQQELYARVMQTHPQIIADQMEAHGFFETINPEQTDKTVNAASTDVIRPQSNAVPHTLWISDEEIADEE